MKGKKESTDTPKNAKKVNAKLQKQKQKKKVQDNLTKKQSQKGLANDTTAKKNTMNDKKAAIEVVEQNPVKNRKDKMNTKLICEDGINQKEENGSEADTVTSAQRNDKIDTMFSSQLDISRFIENEAKHDDECFSFINSICDTFESKNAFDEISIEKDDKLNDANDDEIQKEYDIDKKLVAHPIITVFCFCSFVCVRLFVCVCVIVIVIVII